MPRPTGRGLALLALAAVMYFAGRLVGTWELYLLAFTFLAVAVLSWMSLAATGSRIRVSRSLSPDRPVAGDEPELAVDVVNESFLPGPQMTLRNRLEGLSAADVLLEVDTLAPRGGRLLRARLDRVNRGVYSLPPTEAMAEDPLGVMRTNRRASETLTVTVVPRLVALESCALFPDIGLRHDRSGRKGLRALGASEFRGVRPHQPGEPLSHIDWKSTAKTGVLMLREMEEPAGADITLLLDGTAAEVVGDAPDSNYELAVRAAGSIADFLLRAGRGVELVCHERVLRWRRLTADGGGRRALLQDLAEAQASAPTGLAGALRRLGSDGKSLLQTQSMTIVGISLDQQLTRALLDLREQGARIAFLYVAKASFESTGSTSSLLPFLPPRQADHPAASEDGDAARPGTGDTPQTSSALTALTRSRLLSLSSAGIPCLTLTSSDDLVRRLSLWQPGRRDRSAAL